MSSTPVYGFGVVSENDTEAAKTDTHNENWIKAEGIIDGRALSWTTVDPPGAPSNGDVYIIPDDGGSPSPSGAWAGYAGFIAVYYGGWIFIQPREGRRWYVVDAAIEVAYGRSGSPSTWAEVSSGGSTTLAGLTDVDLTGSPTLKAGDRLVYDGANWIPGEAAEAAAVPFRLVVAASDETTALTAGTAKITFRMPAAVTLTSVRASLTTANIGGSPTSGPITVDINESGVSILSTKLTIDNGEKTSTTAATPAVLSDTSIADDAEITIDIDTAGIEAAGLKVTFIGTYT